MEQWKEEIRTCLDEGLVRAVISNPARKDGLTKVRFRPVRLKGQLYIQAEAYEGKQVFHTNYSPEEAAVYLTGLLEGTFRQGEIITPSMQLTILVSKKGTVTVKKKKLRQERGMEVQDHNRTKQYILQEGMDIPFLQDLGVMTAEGKIVRQRYDKFRQINRFLEFVQDVLPELPKDRPVTVIDFGCGKSYLTFAMYYYLHELQKREVRMIGLDLKDQVIADCSRLAEKYGYDCLEFIHGDIAQYRGVERADMVVTLHACDTATDFALEKAVRWGAKVILSVPCCQHELHYQMKNELMEPVFQYGIIQERMAALYTDAIRAELLEGQGYRTQLLEFIDMEHTPKNILIRAVKKGGKKQNQEALEKISHFLHGRITLQRLLENEGTS